jgi:tRNA (guanine37-N1)-methyltransferase
MTFDIITIFPDQVSDWTKHGLLRIAQEKNLVEINVHSLRDWADDKHKKVDDTPFGGGPGMVLKVEPVYEAIKELKEKETKVIAMTPRGKTLTQEISSNLAFDNNHYIILCGHYEGFDQRVHDNLVDIEVSIGDYILSGGEISALVLVDSISRLIPGVLGNEKSLDSETFNDNDVDFPQYTRPVEFNKWVVPEVLRSGNHKMIEKWRNRASKELTQKKGK